MDYRKGKTFNLMMSHKEAKKFVRKHGYDEFIKEVDDEFNYGLGSASVYWEKDKSYICKMRGSEGDVIIGWDEYHGKLYDE